MTVTPQSVAIRELIARVFAELGVPLDCLDDTTETLLIDRRRYVARSYRARGLLAMWLLSAGVIQFYDAHGKLVRTINLFQEARPHRIAA